MVFLEEYMCIYFKTRSLKDLELKRKRPEVNFFILLNKDPSQFFFPVL